MTKPVTVQEVAGAVAVQVRPPGEAEAVYEVMADPPSLAGAVHETVARLLPAIAAAPVGADARAGGSPEVTNDAAVEEKLCPTVFRATTVA